MKKHILLAIGVAAIYMAAKEYGINSVDDLKRVLKPYLGALDMDEISSLFNSDNSNMGRSMDSQSRVAGVPHES
jgi:hypothetical protein